VVAVVVVVVVVVVVIIVIITWPNVQSQSFFLNILFNDMSPQCRSLVYWTYNLIINGICATDHPVASPVLSKMCCWHAITYNQQEQMLIYILHAFIADTNSFALHLQRLTFFLYFSYGIEAGILERNVTTAELKSHPINRRVNLD
jgi:hypothetical protein